MINKSDLEKLVEQEIKRAIYVGIVLGVFGTILFVATFKVTGYVFDMLFK